MYHEEKKRLFLIEAVTSHGPINVQRKESMLQIFGATQAELIFVTAFLSSKELAKHLSQIAWETEVWLAEAPSHLIHFDGEQFLGSHTPRD